MQQLYKQISLVFSNQRNVFLDSTPRGPLLPGNFDKFFSSCKVSPTFVNQTDIEHKADPKSMQIFRASCKEAYDFWLHFNQKLINLDKKISSQKKPGSKPKAHDTQASEEKTDTCLVEFAKIEKKYPNSTIVKKRIQAFLSINNLDTVDLSHYVASDKVVKLAWDGIRDLVGVGEAASEDLKKKRVAKSIAEGLKQQNAFLNATDLMAKSLSEGLQSLSKDETWQLLYLLGCQFKDLGGSQNRFINLNNACIFFTACLQHANKQQQQMAMEKLSETQAVLSSLLKITEYQDINAVREKYTTYINAMYEKFSFKSSIGLEPQAMCDYISNSNIGVMASVIKHSVQELGKPPCKFTVSFTGSCAKLEGCPNSDVEYFFIVECNNKTTQSYFDRLGKLVDFKVSSFGGTPPRLGESLKQFSDYFKKGFRLDPYLNPGMNPESFIKTPRQYAGSQSTTSFVRERLHSYAIKNSKFVFGDQLLYQEFVRQCSAARLRTFQEKGAKFRVHQEIALVNLEEDLKIFAPGSEFLDKTADGINIKEHCYRFISQVLSWLALYYQITSSNSWKIIEALHKKSVITEEAKANLKKAFDIATSLRIKAHLFYKDEYETMYFEANTPDFLATPPYIIDKTTLEQLNTLNKLFIPIKDAVTAFVNSHGTRPFGADIGAGQNFGEASFLLKSRRLDSLTAQQEKQRFLNLKLAMNPFDTDSLMHLGMTQMQTGDYKESCRTLAKTFSAASLLEDWNAVLVSGSFLIKLLSVQNLFELKQLQGLLSITCSAAKKLMSGPSENLPFVLDQTKNSLGNFASNHMEVFNIVERPTIDALTIDIMLQGEEAQMRLAELGQLYVGHNGLITLWSTYQTLVSYLTTKSYSSDLEVSLAASRFAYIFYDLGKAFEHYKWGDPKMFYFYAFLQCPSESDAQKHMKRMIMCSLVQCYRNQGNLEAALGFYRFAPEVFAEITTINTGDSILSLDNVNVNSLIGFYMDQYYDGRVESAKAGLLTCIDRLSEIDNASKKTENEFCIRSTLGAIFFNDKDFARAIEQLVKIANFTPSAKIFGKTTKETVKAGIERPITLNNLASCQYKLGVSYYTLNKFEDAIRYLKLAVASYTTEKDNQGLTNSLMFLGVAKLETKTKPKQSPLKLAVLEKDGETEHLVEKVMEHLNQAISLRQAAHAEYEWNLTQAFVGLATIANFKNEKTNAIKHAEKAYKESCFFNGFQSETTNQISNILASFYPKKQGLEMIELANEQVEETALKIVKQLQKDGRDFIKKELFEQADIYLNRALSIICRAYRQGNKRALEFSHVASALLQSAVHQQKIDEVLPMIDRFKKMDMISNYSLEEASFNYTAGAGLYYFEANKEEGLKLLINAYVIANHNIPQETTSHDLDTIMDQHLSEKKQIEEMGAYFERIRLAKELIKNISGVFRELHRGGVSKSAVPRIKASYEEFLDNFSVHKAQEKETKEVHLKTPIVQDIRKKIHISSWPEIKALLIKLT